MINTNESKAIKLPYLRVVQKDATFYISRAKAKDLRKIVDFHFREPYKEYNNYEPRDFLKVKEDLNRAGASISEAPSGFSVQRVLDRERVNKITDYIENDPEAIFPSSILIAINTTEYEKQVHDELDELEDHGVFLLDERMSVSVIDGQHRLAGLFLADDEIIDEIEMPVVFMLNVSIPVAAKLFQKINGEQKKVSKSVVFDLFGDIPEEAIDEKDDLEIKRYHTVCVSLYKNPSSPLYRQIKMLGVGGGAISQASFIDACKRELKFLENAETQEKFNELYDYFTILQETFPDDWPKPLGEHTNEEIDEYSKRVLKDRKSQLMKTTGFVAILRIYNWLRSNGRDLSEIEKLKGKVDWTYNDGTGGKAQTQLFEKLKRIIEEQRDEIYDSL